MENHKVGDHAIYNGGIESFVGSIVEIIGIHGPHYGVRANGIATWRTGKANLKFPKWLDSKVMRALQNKA